MGQSWWSEPIPSFPLRPESLGLQSGRDAKALICVPLGTELKTINDFLFQSQIDNINLFKVEDLPFSR